MTRRANIRWTPPVELSRSEKLIIKRCKRVGTLFAFLRRHRHQLFDEPFQLQLAAMYDDTPLGQPPLPPAMLATVTILQAYTHTSDAAAVEAAFFDRRWQMVLDCHDPQKSPFSQGVLVDFRRRLMQNNLHHRLVERSVELAKTTGGFGYKALKLALDSAPLWGAGRVEDTFNLIGHALDIVVRCVAAVAGHTHQQVCTLAGLELLAKPSIKAALDIDWDDKEAKKQAFKRLLGEVEALKEWLNDNLPEDMAQSPIKEALAQLEKLIEQDTEPDPEGEGSQIKRGVARARQISISDPDMRHGRKSRTQKIKGFKRFIARELDHGLILAVTVQPANEPEKQATGTLLEQAEAFAPIEELHIDRGFLASAEVGQMHQEGVEVLCRPWRATNRGKFTKEDFELKMSEGKVKCPAGKEATIRGKTARFSSADCDVCELRELCTRAKVGRGRSISIHAQEGLLMELRAAKSTSEGRARLRERVDVEHGLAHVCNRQGRRARYRGVDKNIFDLCRFAVIENLFAAQRFERAAA